MSAVLALMYRVRKGHLCAQISICASAGHLARHSFAAHLIESTNHINAQLANNKPPRQMASRKTLQNWIDHPILPHRRRLPLYHPPTNEVINLLILINCAGRADAYLITLNSQMHSNPHIWMMIVILKFSPLANRPRSLLVKKLFGF